MGLRGQEGFEFKERKRKKSFKEDGIEKLLLLLLLLSLSLGDDTTVISNRANFFKLLVTFVIILKPRKQTPRHG